MPLAERDGLPAADDGGPARPQTEPELGHAGPQAERDEVTAPVDRGFVLGGVQDQT